MRPPLSLGITSLPHHSHLNTAISIARELKERGHKVIYLGFAETRESVEAAGLDFQVLAEKTRPANMPDIRHEHVKNKVGLQAFKQFVSNTIDDMEFYLPALTECLPVLKLDALIYDQAMVGTSSVMEYLDLDSIQFCNAMAFILTQSLWHPAPFAPMQHYSLNPFYLVANATVSWFLGKSLFRPVLETLNQFRTSHQLPPLKSTTSIPRSKKPRLASLIQLIPELDFPSHFFPRNFFYCGSFSRSLEDQDIAFPFDRLSKKPVIYACLGTVQNGCWDIFQTISKACSQFDVQLVLSFGKKGILSEYPVETLEKNTLAVNFAPQKTLLRRAVLTITHAGVNSPLEALCEGKPMVCIPIAQDQPQMAARMKRAGVAEVVSVKKLTEARLAKAIGKVLHSPCYTQRALFFKDKLHQTGGAARAADIIETTVRYGRL